MIRMSALPYPPGSLVRNLIWQYPAAFFFAVVILRYPLWFSLLLLAAIVFASLHIGVRSIEATAAIPSHPDARKEARWLWVGFFLQLLFLLADIGYVHEWGAFLYPSDIPNAEVVTRWTMAITQWVSAFSTLVQLPFWAFSTTTDQGGPIHWSNFLDRLQHRRG